MTDKADPFFTPPEPGREPDGDQDSPEGPVRREMDGELKTISLIIRTLDKESPEARSRIVAYISSRYVRE